MKILKQMIRFMIVHNFLEVFLHEGEKLVSNVRNA